MSGTLSGILSIAMWSFMAVLIVYSGSTSPLVLTFLSLFIGGLVILIFNIFKKEDFKKLKNISLYDYLFVSCGVCLYTAFIYIAFTLSNPVEANTINYLWPILLGVFSSIRLKKPLKIYEFSGLAISFLGVFLLFLGKENESFFYNINSGHVFAIIAAIIWAAYSTFAKERSYPMIIMAPVFILSGLVCLLAQFFISAPVWPSGYEWVAVLILGVFRISYVFWDYAMKKGNILILSSLSYATPFLSFLFLVLFGVTSNSEYILISVLFVTVGCFLTNLNNLKKWIYKK